LRFPYVAREGLDPFVAQALKAALIAQKKFSDVLDEEYDSLRKEMKDASKFGELKN
jgi:hypothetical protein